MAKKSPTTPTTEKKPGRIAQMRQSYTMAKQADPKIGLWIFLWFLIGFVGGTALMMLIFRGSWVFPIIFGVLAGLLAGLIVFGRRAQRSAISQIEGKPGAAASVLGMLRRGWQVEPVVAVTKQQDVVTRLVGPPGIVLIGEGNPNRLKPLMSTERRKHERVVEGVPVREVIVGNEPGQVPLQKLTRHVTKMGRDLKPAQMTDVLSRLKALDAHRSAIPMPKGPMPTSMKGARGNLRGR